MLSGEDDTSGSRLQHLVESASRELGRPVAIDDRHMRLIAHTEHPFEVDQVRLDALLKRPLPEEVLAWCDAHGVRSANEPVVVAANPRLGMDRRVCAPIRCHGYLLGFLWLIDRDATLSGTDLERAAAIASAAGVVLYRDVILHDLDRSRERELLRDILAAEEPIRAHAAAALVDHGLYWGHGPAVVLVATLPGASRHHSSESIRLTVDAVVNQLRRRLTQKHSLHLVRPDHVLLVVATRDPAVGTSGSRRLARRLHQELEAALADFPDERHVVAISSVAPDLASIGIAYQEALRAAQVAATVPSFGEVAAWDDLGVYKILAKLPVDELGERIVHRGLRELVEDPRCHFLVRTLEVYLDYAGDVQATAASLHVHRTSLYHRLRRVERLAKTDLSSGDERLILHLSLKLGRLAGLDWTRLGVEDPSAMTAAG